MISPEPDFQHGEPSRTGILLINLGTPDAPTAEALRPYLKQFLSNPRVIEIPQWIWWPVLNGIILNTRPKKSAEKYAQVWMPEGSPLNHREIGWTPFLSAAWWPGYRPFVQHIQTRSSSVLRNGVRASSSACHGNRLPSKIGGEGRSGKKRKVGRWSGLAGATERSPR